MRRKLVFAVLASVAAFGHASCRAQEESLKRAQSYDVQTPAGQTELVNGKDSVAKAHFATVAIRRLGGPFQEASFFSAKGELLNKNNIALSGSLVRRDGFHIPFGIHERQLRSFISPFSWTLEMDKWPSQNPLLLPRLNPFGNTAIGFGVEIDIGRFFGRKR